MRLDKHNQKNRNTYVYTTTDKLSSVDFFPKFASFLSFFSDWECFFTKFDKLSTMPHFLFLLLLFWNQADR